MSQFSSFTSKDIPAGDKFRMGTTTTILTTTTTLLNVSSGTSGIIYGINLVSIIGSGAATIDLDTIYVTVDGASERTFTGTFAKVHFPSTTSGSPSAIQQGFITLPIRFTDSIVIKAEVSSAAGGNGFGATVVYSVD
jgi:hypothetical protein